MRAVYGGFIVKDFETLVNSIQATSDATKLMYMDDLQRTFYEYEAIRGTWSIKEEGHTKRYIRQKPGKINKYRAIQQPTMTCRYCVGRLFFILIFSGYTITMENVVL